LEKRQITFILPKSFSFFLALSLSTSSLFVPTGAAVVGATAPEILTTQKK
jgi:hypothetical protein